MYSPFRSLILGCLVGLTLMPVVQAADSVSPENLEFFEKQVRPLLVEHCQECHGLKKQEAGLRLDTRVGFLKGADTGPVAVPGKPDGSRLIGVINYSANDVQMPPKGKLPAEQIAILRKWVELGAPWPAEATEAATDTAKNHWAFQRVKRPTVPPEVNWSLTSIDAFLASALKAKGLTFAGPADRHTFIRRAMLDLWGVPPTFEEVLEFESDDSPDATERLVDRLLASPLYGQRWARHWLDVARYADSKGYVFTAEPRYPYSYTYRDYVVDAFNADTPFDQFVTEQLAADAVVPQGSNDPRLAALGFLTVGRRYLNNNHDIIDDRIDVVSRGLLGLTVGCARCHDHKFDPVPTADYYSLYGIFASSMEPDDLPIIGSPKEAVAFAEFEKELKKREQAVADYEAESLTKVMEELRTRAGDCLIVTARDNQNWLKLPAVFTGKNEPRRQLVERWKRYLEQSSKTEHRVFAPWHQLARFSNDDFSVQATMLIERWKSAEGAAEAAKINRLVREAISNAPPKTLPDLARVYGDLFNQIATQWDAHRKEAADAKSLPDEAAEELRVVLYGEGSPAVVNMDESRRLVGRDVRDKLTQLNRQVENLKVTSPGAPPRAMVMRDGQVHNAPVLIRGNPGRPGKQVPRQFLEVVAGPERKPFTQGSGRLELAQAIVDAKNPLTARVIVNRLWQHHFGTGLVPTPSDFGTRGLPPSNPELLDYLASQLVDGHWSLKRMHQRIMTSAVYRQSSMENEVARGIDPENRLLWRMPRLRIDFEEMRDSMLAVAGRLDASLGGRPFDDVMNPKHSRRTIYAMVNRNDLPGVFRAFDFADVDASAPDRPSTTVPQQALFVMNSPFVLDQARRISADSQAGAADDASRVSLMYRKVFTREPTSDERELALRYLAEALTTNTEKQSPWDRLAQALLSTNEFWFVD
ncbi:MAG: PSD1 domain-containing protein [Planctomycetes bacterium]|nr:PSD1 domain-containing protein [Planctomycetota bacterium]